MRVQSIGKFAYLGILMLGLSAPALAEGDANLEELVLGSDAVAGAAQFRRCMSCHTATEGGPNRVGPNLWGVVGREVGSVDGFRYSRTLGGSDDTWTLENLNTFLESPRTARPGTSMSFVGLRNENDRMNLLAHLRSLHTPE